MKIIYFVFLINLFSINIHSQFVNLEWAQSMGGTSFEQGFSVTTDSEGNVYTTGFFQDTVDFNPGSATYNLISKGSYDIFIQKLDTNGNLVWAKSIGGTSLEQGHSIATDSVGNVYTTGYYKDTVDFDPGSSIFEMTPNNNSDIFIVKLDFNGNFVWAKSIGGISHDQGQSITASPSGNTCITGRYVGTVDFDPGVGVYNQTSIGINDIFILKLDVNGNFVWAKSVGGSSDDIGYSITLDAIENVYVTGFFSGTADFDPSAANFDLTSNGDSDIFILKLDNNGDFVWAKSAGGPSYDEGFSISCDVSGNTYVTGRYMETIDFDPGAGLFYLTANGAFDIFIEKLDSSGNFVWANSMGGTASDHGGSITTDLSGNVYTAGRFAAAVDFDPGTLVHDITSNGIWDIFVQKLDSSGNFIWAKTMGGPLSDYANSIAVDNSENIYLTGMFQETVDFEPNGIPFNLASNGSYDIFVQKLSQCYPNSGTDIITSCNSYTWINGVNYTSNNSNATDTLINVSGCDSIVTLNLTIINSSTGTDTRTECNSFEWIDGNTYTTNNNIATYNISGAATNGCDSTVTLDLTINTVDVTVNQSSITLTANAAGANYQWLDCDNGNSSINEETNQSFTAVSNGNYAVEITQNGCTSISNCILINTAGLTETLKDLGINIYPNPSNGIFIMEVKNDYTIEIVNTIGEIILVQKLTSGLNSIDISSNKNGLYFIKMKSKNTIYINRIVIK